MRVTRQKRTLRVFYCLLLPLIGSAQSLSTKEVLEDFRILREVLTTAHPALCEYTAAEEWEGYFAEFAEREAPGITDVGSLFKSFSSLVAHAKDGHLAVQPPKLTEVPPIFPVWLKIVEEKLYVDAVAGGLPPGTEILAINAVPAPEIVNRLLKFIPADGNNLTKKYRGLEEQFAVLHYYEFGPSKSYSVKWRSPNGHMAETEIPARPFSAIGASYPDRYSHFSHFHGFADKRVFFTERVAPRWPFVYCVDSLHTAVLTVNSFGLDPREFKNRLVDIFTDLRKKKIKNLVIDVRRNAGGYRANAISLYTFLADRPFRQREEERVSIKALPQKNHLIHTPSDYDQFFQKYFGEASREGDSWILRKDHARAEMVPFRKPFRGRVFVLVAGATFSAAAAFALTAKHDPDITLVGEETGGAYHQHVGQYTAIYELPHSKILLRIPLVQIKHYAPDKSARFGRGVFPDRVVSMTVRDLMDGRDAALAQAFGSITRK